MAWQVTLTPYYLDLSQPRSQGLSSLPPLVVGTETLVAAGHMTTQNLGGRKICWKGGATGFCSRPNVLEYPPTLRFWMDTWSRDQLEPGSLFQLPREAEKRVPGNEVGSFLRPLEKTGGKNLHALVESLASGAKSTSTISQLTYQYRHKIVWFSWD